MRRLDGIIDSMDGIMFDVREIVEDRETWDHKESDPTEQAVVSTTVENIR